MGQAKDLPGGQYGLDNPWEMHPRTDRIGDKAGTATRKGGISGALGKLSDKMYGLGDRKDDELRAYTPQEAQKAQAIVDAQTNKNQTKGVAGAIPSYKKGGKIHKTGLARLHKGERVIPKSKVHKVEKAMRKVSRKRG